MERHSAVIAFVATIIYMGMFVTYMVLDPNSVLYDLAFLIVLIVLVIALVAYGISFTWRELKDI